MFIFNVRVHQVIIKSRVAIIQTYAGRGDHARLRELCALALLARETINTFVLK